MSLRGDERDVIKKSPPNQALHLTGAAVADSTGATALQAAPTGELCRSASLHIGES